MTYQAGPLDYEITVKEVEQALNRLKFKKATSFAGYDTKWNNKVRKESTFGSPNTLIRNLPSRLVCRADNTYPQKRKQN